MQRRTPQSIVTLFLSFSLVAFSLIGCHKTDLTGYQQASQKRKSTAEPPAESTVLASAKSEAPAETKDESSVISPVAVTPQEVESFPASALAPLNVVHVARVARVTGDSPGVPGAIVGGRVAVRVGVRGS